MKKIRKIVGVLCTLLIPLMLQGQKIDLEKFSGMSTRAIGPSGMSGRVTAIDMVENNPNEKLMPYTEQ